MNYTLFTVEEENLICAFDTSGRARLIGGIRSALPDFSADDPEMLEIAESALLKLDAMTDAEFSEMVFSPAYEDDESEV
jgi:hypothetical protein